MNQIRYLLSRWPVVLHDCAMVLLAWFLAYWFRFDLDVIPAPFAIQSVAMVPLVIIIQVTVFGIFGLHRGAWRFTSLRDISVIAKAVFVGTATVAIAIFLLTRLEAIPRSVFLLHGVLLVGLLASTRILYRAYRTREIHRSPGKRILIVGAGTAGGMLIRDMLLVRPRVYEPVGFLDDDLEKKGSEIQGVRVLDVSSKMPALVDELRVEQVLLAIPSATSEQMRRIVEFCDQSDVAYITLPRVEDILDGTARLEDLRKIKLDDLLGRESVSLDDETLIQGIAGKRILVTGGGGSIGSELCRQLAHLNPKEMVLLGRHEFSLYAVQQEIKTEFPDIGLQPRLGDVCDEPAVRDVFSRYSPDLVFHTAAYKHVPMLQEQVRETIRNNVIGTEILSRIASESGCKTFVLVSTDKAVNPSSMMGASKRLAEMLVQARNVGSKTSFITVRLGNVLGSTGSVVPLFEKQILEGGPVTVTHPEVTRFLMTRAEACQLVLQACVIGRGGEIFVLNMGEPVKIAQLARQLIRMSGKMPEKDIKIEYTGLRPGEKLADELFHDDETPSKSTHDKILQAQGRPVDSAIVLEAIGVLRQACEQFDNETMNSILQRLVPEYCAETDHRILNEPRRTE